MITLQVLALIGLFVDALYLRSVRLAEATRQGLTAEESAPGRDWWRTTITGALQTNSRLKGTWVSCMYLVVGGFTIFVMGALLSFKSTIIIAVSLVGVSAELVAVPLGIAALSGLRRHLLKG